MCGLLLKKSWDADLLFPLLYLWDNSEIADKQDREERVHNLFLEIKDKINYHVRSIGIFGNYKLLNIF